MRTRQAATARGMSNVKGASSGGTTQGCNAQQHFPNSNLIVSGTGTDERFPESSNLNIRAEGTGKWLSGRFFTAQQHVMGPTACVLIP